MTLYDIPGFKVLRHNQAFIKAVSVGMSVFHLKAENLAAQGNMGLAGWLKGQKADVESAWFKGEELDGASVGMVTTMHGRATEVYHAAQSRSFPTRLDIVRGLPGFKQVDNFAQWLTYETFDVGQRKFKVVDYALKKAAWMAKHLGATEEQLLEAKRSIAKEVNATYGSMHWENLGLNKNTLEVLRAFLLAPDWTYSNIFHLKYALEGGPAGKASRTFWARSLVTAIVLTQGMSIIASGKPSSSLTKVYLGKDDQGREIYSNVFFSGSLKDSVTLVDNAATYGAIEGLGRTIASKMGPVSRAGLEVTVNKDWMGRDIAKRGEGFIAGTVKGAARLGSSLAPIPFNVADIAKMLTDEQDHNMWEYGAILSGSRASHVAPGGAKTRRTAKKGFTIRSTK
jgi:hypothetical protein